MNENKQSESLPGHILRGPHDPATCWWCRHGLKLEECNPKASIASPAADSSRNPCATHTGVVICPHGEVEAYCSICDLAARVQLRDAIALAVMAERERAARIADKYGLDGDGYDNENGGNVDFMEGYRNAATGIAQEIRSGE